MILTILEVLENADYNLQKNADKIPQIAIPMAKQQLHNALDLLNQGMSLDDDFDEAKLSKNTKSTKKGTE